jgi:methyl-accepting chemotaxis protein
MKSSILRNLMMAFMGFGLAMGMIFPVYASFFVDWKEGMRVWFISGCVMAGLIMGIANYMLLKMLLVDKLQSISKVANAITNKDITPSCDMKSDDVIGVIIDSFNSMGVNLRQLIDELNQSSQTMTNSVGLMRDAASATNSQVTDQFTETERLATAISAMTENVNQVASNAEKAAESARLSKGEAEDGKQVVGATISSINSLADEVDAAATVIQNLEHETDNIGTVLDVIRGIAEQTNLLALNAAIEAARAGEQGRGFAVVADEVRTLARRTQNSTEEIQKMIQNLQSGSHEAVLVMERGKDMAHSSVAQANKAGNSLEEITKVVTVISDMNTQIASAADEQSELAREINESIGKIAEIANTSTSSSVKTAKVSQDLSGVADHIESLVSGYKTR